MTVFHWICLAGFTVCFAACMYQLLRILTSRDNIDHALPKGETRPAIIYSFTKAMSPAKKETAFKHLPTYAAGLIYHLGTFLAFLWLLLIFLNITASDWIRYISYGLLIVSGICGISILIKRITTARVRHLSNPDDYLSNLLVTAFHFVVANSLLYYDFIPVLLIYATILFLYIPVGKLRHTVYFFTSRMHLGIFFGRRGVWPVKKREV